MISIRGILLELCHKAVKARYFEVKIGDKITLANWSLDKAEFNDIKIEHGGLDFDTRQISGDSLTTQRSFNVCDYW